MLGRPLAFLLLLNGADAPGEDATGVAPNRSPFLLVSVLMGSMVLMKSKFMRLLKSLIIWHRLDFIGFILNEH